MTENNITELLEDYVSLLEESGIPRDSTESKLMLRAKEEIEHLRNSLENANNLYESTCKSVREKTVSECVCGMCKWDCDTSVGPSGEYMQECPGFNKDDCFELNREKYNDIIFEKKDTKSKVNTVTQANK